MGVVPLSTSYFSFHELQLTLLVRPFNLTRQVTLELQGFGICPNCTGIFDTAGYRTLRGPPYTVFLCFLVPFISQKSTFWDFSNQIKLKSFIRMEITSHISVLADPPNVLLIKHR